MRIVLVTNYWHFPSEKASARYSTLAAMLATRGHEVEVVTSNFRHATKTFRDPSIVEEVPTYRVTMLQEAGYSKNLSIRRLRSHASFARRAAEYISAAEPPDVVYCVVPTLSLGDRMVNIKWRSRTRLVVDVQDLWPEAFAMAVRPRWLFRILTAPMRRQARRVYAGSDAVVAVSETYRHKAVTDNPAKPSVAVFLGVDLKRFDEARLTPPILKKPSNELWVTYVGTLGHSYDLPLLIDACAGLEGRLGDPHKLLIIGDGPKRAAFEAKAKASSADVQFLGNLPYHEMVALLTQSDVAVNPIVERSEASVINKHADYLAAGVPMVSSQKSEEVVALLDAWGAGSSTVPGSAPDMARELEQILNNRPQREEMGRAARKLAEAKFDRATTYPAIVQLLENL